MSEMCMNKPAYVMCISVCVCVWGVDMNNVCIGGGHVGVYLYTHGRCV